MLKEDKLHNDFTTFEIIEINKLGKDLIHGIYVNLYENKINSLYRQMLVYIIKNNIGLLSEIKDIKYIYKDEQLMMKTIVDLYFKSLDETKIELDLDYFNNTEDTLLSGFNENYIRNVFYIRKLYEKKLVKFGDLKNFIDFHMNYLRKAIIEVNGNYNASYDKLLYNLTISLINGDLDIKKYINLSMFNLNSYILNDMYDSNIENHYLTHKIPLMIIATISPKKVKTMYKIFSKYSYKSDYSYGQMIMFFIRLSALIGEDRADNIIRHLPEKKYQFDNLYNCICNFNLDVIKFSGNNIVYNEDFIKYFMGSDLKQTQSALNLIYKNEFLLNRDLDKVYDNFDELFSRFKRQNHFTLLKFIDEEFKKTDFILNPDEYKLEWDIINAAVKDKSFIHLNDDEVIKKVRKTYKDMRHNFKKNIPYVEGAYKDYTYCTLKANDPTIFALGACTFCCFKIGGEASLLLEYIAKREDGRILVIRDKENKICTMIPMVRNGNLVLCNSIESRQSKNKKFMNDMLSILKFFSSKVIEISKKSEAKREQILAVLCGNYKNQLEDYSGYEKIDTTGYTSKLVAVGDKYNILGSNLGYSAGDFYIIEKSEDFDKITEKNLFVPSILYEDDFCVREVELDMISEEEKAYAQRVIDSINYKLNNKLVSINDFIILAYSDEFYVAINKDYTISHGFISPNIKVKNEYLEYLKLMREYSSYFNKDNSFIL